MLLVVLVVLVVEVKRLLVVLAVLVVAVAVEDLKDLLVKLLLKEKDLEKVFLSLLKIINLQLQQWWELLDIMDIKLSRER